MANGGIIGPVNTVNAASCTPVAANIVAVTATGPYSKPASHPGAGAVMLVAGGGGSSMEHAGGGGAGGVILNPSITLASGPIVIGAGGNGVAGCTQTSGNNTTGFSLTAIGGGHAGSYNNAAEPGGSGGGGPNNSLVPTAAGTGTACQGNNGGTGSGCHGGGGGGGAAAVGANGPGGAGGAGIDVTPVFGSAPQPFYIANGSCAGASVGGIFGGGGGGTSGPSTSGSSGGIGGGGDGTGGAPAPESGTSGIASTGGGGGGGRTASGGVVGGSGGAGYALIKENAYNIPVPASAPGVWSMNSVYDFVKSDNWVYNNADVDYLVVGGGGGGGQAIHPGPAGSQRWRWWWSWGLSEHLVRWSVSFKCTRMVL